MFLRDPFIRRPPLGRSAESENGGDVSSLSRRLRRRLGAVHIVMFAGGPQS